MFILMRSSKPMQPVKPKGPKANSKPAGISEKVIRCLDIYTMIAQGKYPCASSLMEHFGVAERTVFRYLELINFIDSIEFDSDRRGYKFSSGDRIKKARLSEQELLILLATTEAVSRLGKPFEEKFRGLVEKMMLVAKVPSLDHGLSIVVKIPEAVGSEKVSKHFSALSTCATEKRSIELTYLAQHTKETTKRVVDPYGLVFYEGVWIMVGYCHLRKAIRNFALDRIMDVKERYRYFKRPTGFSLEEHLSQSWGVFDGEEVTVRLLFAAQVADYVLRKTWHPSEKRSILPDGRIECTYRVTGASEIKRWLYSWLPNVEVLEPDWLREQIHQELLAASTTHS